jgi:hypothetical protein
MNCNAKHSDINRIKLRSGEKVDGIAGEKFPIYNQMIRWRTKDAGFKVKLGCHVFRATGIIAYLEAGGSLENAQAMAAHESPRTTKL